MKHYHKLDEKLARLQNIVIVFLTISIVALIAVFIVTNQKTVVQKKITKPTIALVNEDLPATFNQANYNLGKSFVDSVSNDKHYNWQVVSRSVADRAYKENSVDAVIYLPQTFSHDLLTLQEIDPTQTKVDYKVQHQDDDLLDSVLENKITSVLYDFNQDVVKMYYASVAGNIAEAENNMNGVVSKHELLVSDLIGQVKTPFGESLPNYNIFISGANGLKSMNQATISAHNSFTEMTTKTLTQTSDSFAKQGSDVNAYFELQKQIANQNVLNANKGIENQAKQNQDFYFSQFTSQNQNILERMSLLNFQERDGTSDETFEEYKKNLEVLEDKVKSYNTKNESIEQDLTDQVAVLEGKRDKLLDVEKDLYVQFFDTDLPITKDNYDNYKEQSELVINSDFAREALAKKVQNSFVKDINLPLTDDKKAIKSIQDLISQISVNDLDYKLDTLLKRKSITQETKDKYEAELDVIQKYASAYQLTTGNVALAPIPEEDGAVTHEMTQVLTVKVPPRTTYISNSLSSSVSDLKSVETGRTIVAPDGGDTDGSGDGASPDGSGNGGDTSSSGDGSGTDESGNGGDTSTSGSGSSTDKSSTGGSTTDSPSKEKVEVKKRAARSANLNEKREIELENTSDDIVEYTVTLTVTLDESNSESFEVAWKNGQELVYSSTLTFVFVTRDSLASYSQYVGIKSFDELTNLFNKIDLTANLIATFYAAPDKSYVDLKDAKSKSDFETSANDSIFNLYGNMNTAFISKKLSNQDVSSFLQQGEKSIKEVIDLIKKLDEVIKALGLDKDNLTAKLPEDYFPSTLESLQNWRDKTVNLIDTNYQHYKSWTEDTLSSIDTTYQGWQVNEAKQLEVKNWEDYSKDEEAIYINNSNDLYEQLNSLITTSNETSKSIAQSAQTVQDNSNEFEMLVASANTTQADAQKVLSNTNKLADTGSFDLGASKNYYTNFSQVLANTRTQGADTNAIYDFFAKPILSENKTPERKAFDNAKNFDYRSPLMFMIGLFGGMLLLMGWNKFSMRKMKQEV